MENNLPKEGWYVCNDDSQLFKDTVIKYLNSLNQQQFKEYDKDYYYGVTKDNKAEEYSKGNISLFGSNAKKLIIQEFIELSKEKEEKFNNKKLSPEQLLEKANSSYPIGAKYKIVDTYSFKEYTIKFKLRIYKVGEVIQITDGCGGSVYYDGKWAEIVSTPEVKTPTKGEFKKDDYIVLLNEFNENFKTNFCYKQRKNDSSIKVYKDLEGDENGTIYISYNTTSYNYKWRYATKQEITYYDKIGKPFDVTSKEEFLDWCNSFCSLNKEFNHNFYVEVKSQQEYQRFCDWLESNGETYHKGLTFDCKWKWISFNEKSSNIWCLTNEKPNKLLKTLLDLGIEDDNSKWVPKENEWDYSIGGREWGKSFIEDYMKESLQSLGINRNSPEHCGELGGLRVKQSDMKISKVSPIKGNQLNSNINKQTNGRSNSKSNNNALKVQGSNLQISGADRPRTNGLKCSGSKIKCGTHD